MGMRFLTRKDLKFPRRKPGSHKGDNGRLLVVTGSRDYAGAACLSSMAAFRTGVDQVLVAAPSKVGWVINTYSPDIMTKKFDGDFFTVRHAAKIRLLAKNFDAMLIGNGLGLASSTRKFVKQVVKAQIPKVIDADAIKSVRLQEVRSSILTPHSRELEILLHNSGYKTATRQSSLQKKAAYLRRVAGSNVILLKGKEDIIVSAGKAAFNRTGNPGMTHGGTGDVLAGITAALVAQGIGLFDAACTAAFVNGHVGDALEKKKGYGFTASDMLEGIPAAVRELGGW